MGPPGYGTRGAWADRRLRWQGLDRGGAGHGILLAPGTTEDQYALERRQDERKGRSASYWKSPDPYWNLMSPMYISALSRRTSSDLACCTISGVSLKIPSPEKLRVKSTV